MEEIKSKHALQLKDILLGHNLEVQELQKQFEDTCKTLEQDKQSRWNSDKKIIERDLKNRLRDERDKVRQTEIFISYHLFQWSRHSYCEYACKPHVWQCYLC